MKVEQRAWTATDGWSAPSTLGGSAQLVLLFGAPGVLSDPARLAEVRATYPGAHLAGASTAGEIHGDDSVRDDSLVATAVSFARTRVDAAWADVPDMGASYKAGETLARALDAADLVHVLVFADGTRVNGTELVRGFLNELPKSVAVTGGLAADGDRFGATYVAGPPGAGTGAAVAVGLYGHHLRVGYGSLGGWDISGTVKRVTRAEGNVVHEIDGRPALDLYKEILGDKASGLPAAGLLHPLLIQTPETEFVRTLVGVDERAKTLTFAGEVPVGERTYVMKANFERLLQGAEGAARDSFGGTGAPELALLVSCVGRRLVLKERTDAEIASVRKVLGTGTAVTGFYSYGEICPTAPGANCALHNQTMTITTLRELDESGGLTPR